MIIKGNCIDIMEDIDNDSIDLVVTDPPYEIGTRGAGINNKRKWMKNVEDADLNQFNPKPFLELIKKKMETFNAYIFTSKDLLKDYIEFIEENDYNWNLLFLAKRNPIPTKNNKYLPDTELIIFIREKGAYFNSDREFDYYRKVKKVSVTKNEYHPTQKDVQPLKEMISISSKEDDLILDPFIGSGTTALACKELNRNYIGIEKNEKYCKIARERLDDSQKCEGLDKYT